MASIDKLLGAKEMALQGHSQIEIAKTFGVAQPTVSKWLKAARALNAEDLDTSDDAIVGKVVERTEYEPVVPLSEDQKVQLSLELERLDSYIRDLNRLIRDNKHDADVVNKTIRTALAVHDRRAKYLGLDRPISFETESTIKFTVEGVDKDKLT